MKISADDLYVCVVVAVLIIGIFIGHLFGMLESRDNNYEDSSTWKKGYNLGYRKGIEDSEKKLLEKLKKL